MYRHVVPSAVVMVLSVFYPLRAFAVSCNGLANAELYKCLAMVDEIQCLGNKTQVPSIPAATCSGGAGAPLEDISGATSQADIDSAFKASIANLKSRSDACCKSGAAWSDCPGAPDESSGGAAVPAPGLHTTQTADVDGQRATGKSQATRAGYCEADKKICEQMAGRAPAPSANCANGGSPCTTANLKDLCGSELQAGTQGGGILLASATSNFTKADQVDPQGTQAGPGGKTDGTGGGGSGTKDGGGSPTKTASKSGGGMNPMSMLGPLLSQLAQQQQQQPTDPPKPPDMASVNCGPGIVSAQCPAQATPPTSDSFNKSTGTSNFQTASSKASGFNPADTGLPPGTGKTGPAPVDTSQQGQPLGATVVANGGGPMAGGGGGGGSATLGGGGGGGAVPAGMNRTPDLGLSSHSGYSAQNASMSTAAGGSGGFSGYGKGSEDAPINYADWLPKGKNDPTRTIAGGNMHPMQIQSREVNIWNRISDHIKQRCSLGLLRDCVP